jgi:REP element-mobilizing transposase RayT
MYRDSGNLRRSKYVRDGRYFITDAARAPVSFLNEPVPRFILLKDLVVTLVIKRATLITLALLPDHIHMMLRISSADTSKIMNSFRARSARDINRIIRPRDEFSWEQSFYDRLAWDEKEFDRLNRYILTNPEEHGVDAFTWSGGSKPGFPETVERDVIAFYRLGMGRKPISVADGPGGLEERTAALEIKINKHVADFFGLKKVPDLISKI